MLLSDLSSLETIARKTLVVFPFRWDGENLDSPDQKSHVAYATDPTNVGPTGTCLASRPVVTPQVDFEATWDIRADLFHGEKMAQTVDDS